MLFINTFLMAEVGQNPTLLTLKTGSFGVPYCMACFVQVKLMAEGI
jgi:hypothetical protein